MKSFIIMGEDTYNEYIKENTQNLLGTGKDGTCYKTLDNEVLKIYNRNVSEKRMLQFSDVENESVMFPENVISVNNKIKAMTRSFVDGYLLSRFDYLGSRTDIELLANALKKLKNEITKLSEDGVLAHDIVWSNIIWDTKDFKFIDTYSYYRSKASKDYILFCNLREMIDPLLNWIISKNIYEFFLNTEIKNIFLNANYLENPDDILLCAKDYLENYLDERITNFNQADKKLLLKKYKKF